MSETGQIGTSGIGEDALADAIETWEVYQSLRSLRKTGKVIHASKSAVHKRLKRVAAGLKSGELEIIGGKMREKRSA